MPYSYSVHCKIHTRIYYKWPFLNSGVCEDYTMDSGREIWNGLYTMLYMEIPKRVWEMSSQLFVTLHTLSIYPLHHHYHCIVYAPHTNSRHDPFYEFPCRCVSGTNQTTRIKYVHKYQNLLSHFLLFTFFIKINDKRKDF